MTKNGLMAAAVIGAVCIAVTSVWLAASNANYKSRLACVSPVDGTTCAVGYATLGGMAVGSAIACNADRPTIDLASRGVSKAIDMWAISKADAANAAGAYTEACAEGAAMMIRGGATAGDDMCSRAVDGLSHVEAWSGL